MWKRQVPRFLLAGGFAAAVNFGSRFVFSHWMRYEWAVLTAYGLGVITGFALMRAFVFDGQGQPFGPQLAKYLAVNVFGALQTFLISVALARWALPAIGFVTHAEAAGHLVGLMAPIVTSYYLHRLITFKPERSAG